MRRLIVGLLALAISSPAFAQSSPNLTTGQVPTAAQWNSFFIAKQDVLGFVPLSIAGGTMTGRLITAPSTTTPGSGLRLPHGAAPTTPTNGDLWTTTAGLFVRVNGTTVGPLVSAAGSGVTSVTASDASLTISPTAGAVLASLNVSNANTWVGAQSFAPTGFAIRGSTSGTIDLRVAAIAGTSIITFPNGTTDFSATGGASQVLKQVSAGAAITVGTLSCADLSNDAASCATDATNATNITSGTLPSGRLTGSYTGITGTGTLTAGATGAGFTVALTTSTVTGTIPSANVSGSYTGITGLGTITVGVWNGTDIAVADGGTGSSSASGARTNLAAASTTTNAQTGAMSFFFTTVADQDYRVVIKIPFGGTITETVTRSASGTCTFTSKINTTALGGTANSVSSSEQAQAHASSNTFVTDDDIVITVSANSACTGVSYTAKFTYTLSGA